MNFAETSFVLPGNTGSLHPEANAPRSARNWLIKDSFF
jgi:hypothetical protein